MKSIACLILLHGLLGGCSGSKASNIAIDDQCNQGFRWDNFPLADSGDEFIAAKHQGAPEMYPGQDCIACHNSRIGDSGAPSFVLAGTVFANLKEQDNCFGVASARIEITDNLGEVYTMLSNPAGNYFLLQDEAPNFQFPYRARVLFEGRTREMPDPQDSGSCNFCHTVGGANGAPGRVTIP